MGVNGTECSKFKLQTSNTGKPCHQESQPNCPEGQAEAAKVQGAKLPGSLGFRVKFRHFRHFIVESKPESLRLIPG